MIYRLENPEFLYLLLVIPFLIGAYWFSSRVKKKNLKIWGEWKVIKKVITGYSAIRPLIKFSLALLALILLIGGLANFQIGSRTEEQTTEGVDIVLVLDVSNSMLAQDIKPNRLEFGKQLIDQLIDNLQNDRVGLVIFAGETFNLLPLSNDKSLLYTMLRPVNTNSIPSQGTAIGSALEAAIKLFDEKSNSGKAIVIFTDGEDHEEFAVQQAKIASENKITIHSVGIGSQKGAPIPIIGEKDQKITFKKNQLGKRVVSKMNSELLQEIAAISNGEFIHAKDNNTSFEPVLEEIKSMERRTFSETTFTNFQHRFQYFFGATLLFLLLDLFIFESRRKLAEKV